MFVLPCITCNRGNRWLKIRTIPLLPSNLRASSFHPSAEKTSISLLLSTSPPPPPLPHTFNLDHYEHIRHSETRSNFAQLSSSVRRKVPTNRPDDDSSVVQRVPRLLLGQTLLVCFRRATHLESAKRVGDRTATFRETSEEGSARVEPSCNVSTPRVCDVTPIEKAIIGARQRVCGKVGAPPTFCVVFCQSIPHRPRDDIYIAGKMRFCTSAHTGIPPSDRGYPVADIAFHRIRRWGEGGG